METEWSGYRVDESLTYKGTMYSINRIDVYHEIERAYAVLSKGTKELELLELPYEGGSENGNA